MKLSRCVTSLMFVLGCLLLPAPLLAYGGPGSIVSGVGAFLALLAAIGAALFGFFWYPIKRLLKKAKEPHPESGPTTRGEATAGE